MKGMKGRAGAILSKATRSGGSGKPSLAGKPYTGNKGMVKSGKASNQSKYSAK